MKKLILLSIVLFCLSPFLFADEINTMHLVYIKEKTNNGLANALLEMGVDANLVEVNRYTKTREELWWDGNSTALVVLDIRDINALATLYNVTTAEVDQSQTILSDDRQMLVCPAGVDCFMENFPLTITVRFKRLLTQNTVKVGEPYIERRYDSTGELEREEKITIEQAEFNINLLALPSLTSPTFQDAG